MNKAKRFLELLALSTDKTTGRFNTDQLSPEEQLELSELTRSLRRGVKNGNNN